MSKSDIFGALVGTIAVILIMSILWYQDNSCRDEGGAFVQTVFWYECINKNE